VQLGALDDAERNALEALAFYEPRSLRNVYGIYENLEAIATARGHIENAAAWRAKKAAKFAQLQRLARGDGDG
jgi:hypothetical protein